MSGEPAGTRAWLAPLAIFAGLAPFAASVSYGFTLDDSNTILGHKGVQGPLSFDDLVLRDWWGRSRFDSVGTWRPLPTLTFWVDQHISGGRPWLFHFTNLVLYAALLALLNRLLRRWGGPALTTGARLGAVVLFGVLAIHGDVVPSATGRAEILAAIFSLGAIDAATCRMTLGAREVAASLACLFLAFVSKESSAPMAILVPFLARRVHAGDDAESKRGVLTLAIASPLVLGGVAAFRALRMPFMQLGPERALENPLLAVDGAHRVAGSFEVLALYLRHFAGGSRLAPDYSFAEPLLLTGRAGAIVQGGGAWILLGAVVAVCWRRIPRVADAAIAFLASYLTVSNLLVASSAIADRLFFLPSLWLCVVGALVIDRLVRARGSRRIALGCAAAFAALQAWRAFAYAAEWRDDVTLLTSATQAYPNVYRTQRNLAHALADAHDDDGAAWHLTVAEAIYARYPMPVARDAIDPTWDGEPLERRLGHLGGSFTVEAVCAAAHQAGLRLASWDAPGAAERLAGPVGRLCPH